MKKKLLVVALGLSSSMALVGCGSGDSGDSGGGGLVTTPTSVFYNVKVIDGYLKNAQVWLDIDDDKQLDAGEPVVFSGDGGVAALDVTNVTSPEQYSTYAKIIFGQTVDEDRGPVASSYIMSAPPGDKAITPLSTWVSIVIAQNTDGNETAEQLASVKQAAIAKVAKDLGIQESHVLSDYIANTSASTAYAAENMVNSKILPEDENEFIVAIADNSDNATFNKQATAVSGMIKAIVDTTLEADFDTQAAVFDSNDDVDTDSDADDVPDAFDAFPNDANEWLDSDGDLIGNNADPDDDNDGVEDSRDADPLDPTVGEYDECVVKYTASGASIDDFNAELGICDGLPEMDLAGNALIRLTNSIQPRLYVFNIDNTAAFYRNGVQYHRIWEINNDGNLALYTGDGQTLNYLMRLIDNSTENLKFAVYDNGKQSIWTTRYQDVDVSVDIIACENLASGWDDVNNVPLVYRSYDEFKQAITSCQEGKLVADFSAGFIDQGIMLTTAYALNQADDVDTYQFNQDGSGIFTYNKGAGDVSVPMTWTIHEEGVVKAVFNYTDANAIEQTAHDYLAIVETNGIDFSIKVFSRSTEWQGLGDTALGELSSRVMDTDDID